MRPTRGFGLAAWFGAISIVTTLGCENSQELDRPDNQALPFCNPTFGADVCLYTTEPDADSFCSKACATSSDCADMPDGGGCCEDIGEGELYCRTAALWPRSRAIPIPAILPMIRTIPAIPMIRLEAEATAEGAAPPVRARPFSSLCFCASAARSVASSPGACELTDSRSKS